jgi:predicted  nucleic acid-binding Zn-ribbon protein
MSLARAIQKTTPSFAAAAATYQENVAAVNQVVTAVLASGLPTLHTDPPDWADFVTAYEQANADALTWVNQVMGHLLSVPEDVRNYNTIVSQLLADAGQQARTLVDQPGNATALTVLDQDLQTLTGQLGLVTTFITDAVAAVEGFQNKLPDMAGQLQAIATKSTQDAGADQKQIDDLNAAIQALRDDISAMTAAIVALGIADGVALTLGIVATIAAWPVGALTWLVMGPVVLAATTFLAIDAQKIVDDKRQIEAKEQQITGITADVATLHTLAQQFASLSEQATALTDSLKAILAEWQSLETEVGTAVTDIRTATADASAANFQAVVDDLTAAGNEWTQAYAQAGTLFLDLQVNTAPLQVGMSQEEMQQAMATGETMSLIDYWNREGVPGQQGRSLANA